MVFWICSEDDTDDDMLDRCKLDLNRGGVLWVD